MRSLMAAARAWFGAQPVTPEKERREVLSRLEDQRKRLAKIDERVIVANAADLRRQQGRPGGH